MFYSIEPWANNAKKQTFNGVSNLKWAQFEIFRHNPFLNPNEENSTNPFIFISYRWRHDLLSTRRSTDCHYTSYFLRGKWGNSGSAKANGREPKTGLAEFSTLSQAVLMMSIYLFTWTHAPSWKLGPGLVLLA